MRTIGYGPSPFNRRLCKWCTRAVHRHPGGAEVDVSILIADVRGSTALAERIDPESLRRVMSRYYDEMRLALERHGGTVAKFIGDAVLGVFGVPTAREDDALRAVRAAVDMRASLPGLSWRSRNDGVLGSRSEPG
jgi:class 3 adenylate cyclase